MFFNTHLKQELETNKKQLITLDEEKKNLAQKLDSLDTKLIESENHNKVLSTEIQKLRQEIQQLKRDSSKRYFYQLK